MTEVVPSPEGAATPAAPQDALGRFLLGWSQLSALCGVALLLGICLLSTWSVLGRALFDSPVMGDVEIVQIICSLAIASFLPYAQMKNAHVIVDFFTHGASARTRAVLMVEHNLNVVADICDHVTVLQRGEIIARGPGSEMAARGIRRLVAI